MTRSLSCRVALAVLGGALALSCGSDPPTVNPSPTPVAQPSPTPTPDANVPPAGNACAQPYPPPVTRFTAKIHLKEKDYWTLDSTPLVGPDAEYCAKIGFTDGRTICPLRPEGAPDRADCEAWRVGRAKDTGQVGPTWTFVGKDGTTSYCTGPLSPCEHVGNPYLLKAYLGGLYRVCNEAGACGEVDVDRNL
jgi:hypothetical protein